MHNTDVLSERVGRWSVVNADDWSTVERRNRPKVLLVFGVKSSLSLVESKILYGDIGFGWLVSRTLIRRLYHMRIIIKHKFVKFFTQAYVKELSGVVCVRYGWRCVCNELMMRDANVRCNNYQIYLKLLNRFDLLQQVS